MTEWQPLVRPQIDVTSWSDPGSRGALDLVASSVAEMVGFEIAIVSVLRGDLLYAVSVEGSNEATAAMLGVSTPVSMVAPELERADDWGRFYFVPHDRLEWSDQSIGWTPDLGSSPAPDAWHPLDLLVAPLYDENQSMIGLLSIDVPLSGLRPDQTQRHLLERYVVQAERALRMAVERHALSEQIRQLGVERDQLAERVIATELRMASEREELASQVRQIGQERDALAEHLRSYTAVALIRPRQESVRDVFLSHASEDKDEIARPLRLALEARGVTVWFDEIQIKVGDSIRHEIERGIKECRFGVVIISPHFFSKHWTNAELDALFDKRMGAGGNVLLPVWHRVSKDEVMQHSPMLAGILALSTAAMTVEEVGDALAHAVHERHDTRPSKFTE